MHSAGLLVLGTANRKKARELVDLLADVGLTLSTLADFPQALVVEETGDSFAANAALKATSQARHLGHWVLGEDSGIVVDALGGARASTRPATPDPTPLTRTTMPGCWPNSATRRPSGARPTTSAT